MGTVLFKNMVRLIVFFFCLYTVQVEEENGDAENEGGEEEEHEEEEVNQEEEGVVDEDSTDGSAVLVNRSEGEEEWGTINKGNQSA